MSLLFESTKQRERGLKERKLSPSFLLVNVDWNINLILHLAYPPKKNPLNFTHMPYSDEVLWKIQY